MAKYRVGKHWQRTIVEEGSGPEDRDGRRKGDRLVGMVDTPELAAQIVSLLNSVNAPEGEPGSPETDPPAAPEQLPI